MKLLDMIFRRDPPQPEKPSRALREARVATKIAARAAEVSWREAERVEKLVERIG